MTRFILHGGFATGAKQEDDAFFKEIIKNTPDRGNILLVYFAGTKSHIPAYIRNDTEQFERCRGEKVIYLLVAERDAFADQTKNADTIYFHGGVSLDLLGVLKGYPELRELLKGKVVAGDSAGVNVFGKMFYSKSSRSFFHGLGYLPMGIICHYGPAYAHVLDDAAGDLEILRIPEYETKSFDVDL